MDQQKVIAALRHRLQDLARLRAVTDATDAKIHEAMASAADKANGDADKLRPRAHLSDEAAARYLEAVRARGLLRGHGE